ncbi:MAG: hypothetical protein GX800_09835 [Clostridiaceae bacterium]|nr:hypothetical protein [Clostridiaceae bacterium]
MAKQWPDASSAGALESWAAAYKYDGLPFIFIRNLTQQLCPRRLRLLEATSHTLQKKTRTL